VPRQGRLIGNRIGVGLERPGRAVRGGLFLQERGNIGKDMVTVLSGTLKEGIPCNQPGALCPVACPADWAFDNHIPFPLEKNIKKRREYIDSVDGSQGKKL